MAARTQPSAGAFALSEEEYLLLDEFLVERFGLHFPPHKRGILQSRLRPVMERRGLTVLDYLHLLDFGRADDLRELSRAVTNNETYFFREMPQFEAVFAHGLDDLRAAPSVAGRLSVLCAGCSSGEEPYTLAIVAGENRHRFLGLSFAIDAFDLDDDRIKQALAARYGQASFRALDPAQIERYFRRADPGSDLRELKAPFRAGVRFRTGNIIDRSTYAGASRYDVVVCRNVLIYFSEVALRRAIDNFASVLRPDGLLLLGHSESIIGMTPRFEPVRLGSCIVYRRTGERR